MNEFLEKQCKWLNDTEGNLHLHDGHYCQDCKSKGFFYKIRGEEIVAVKCPCLNVRRNLRLFKESGLDKTLESKTFDNFIVKENWQKIIKEKAQNFLNNKLQRIFFIGGQCGAGKTHICTAMCAQYIKRSIPTLYLLWTRDVRQLKAVANDYTFSEAIAPYKSVEVLYIDDFLKVMQGSTPTPADINIAFEIINSRLRDPSKITIISSEFSIDELLELDEGTASRICEGAGEFAISISKSTHKNYRLRKDI